jgi:hypothetical protein
MLLRKGSELLFLIRLRHQAIGLQVPDSPVAG